MTNNINTGRESLLRKLADEYYNGQPSVSDSEYNAIYQLHARSRSANPHLELWKDTILDKVGAPSRPSSGFRKVNHIEKLLSLENVFEKEPGQSDELMKWLGGLGDGVELSVEPKADGLSAVLYYSTETGELRTVVTRGTGEAGDDITSNFLAYCPGTPRHLDATLLPKDRMDERLLIVRGEIVMTKQEFDLINKRMAEQNEPLLKNPRNGAAGVMRRKHPGTQEGAALTFVAHGVGGKVFKDHGDAMAFLRQSGFETTDRGVRVVAYASGTRVELGLLKIILMENMPYECDGVVFKVMDYELRDKLGTTSKDPRWAVALKTIQEEVATTLNSITVQVSRQGVLTPVAELEPVLLGGVMVSRATLHNEDYIQNKRITPGDEVVIERAGAVIPSVKRSITGDENPERGATYRFYMHRHLDGKCPVCSTPIQQQKLADGSNGAKWLCPNPDCASRLSGAVLHFCGRSGLDIQGVGPELAQAMAAQLRIDAASLGRKANVTDILYWKVDDFAKLVVQEDGELFGSARAEKVVASMRESVKLPLHRWLCAMGIPNINVNTSREISRLFRTCEDLVFSLRGMDGREFPVSRAIKAVAAGESKKSPEIAAVGLSHHLGPVSCKSLLDFVCENENMVCFKRMLEHDVVSDNYTPGNDAAASSMGGKVFVITGTMSVPREDIAALIQAAGGRVSGSVTSKTNYLVVGEGGGKKRSDAEKLNVPVLTEQELRNMLS